MKMEAKEPTPSPEPARGLSIWLKTLLVFLVTLALTRIARSTCWYLSGDDVYFHLAAARRIKEAGWSVNTFPALRMSLLGEHWGNPYLLFHGFLIPFLSGDVFSGAKWALSLLNAAQAALLAFLGMRWGGRHGWALPVLIVSTAPVFLWRADQLRPHNLSLILFLAGICCLAARKAVPLALTALMYTLTYTAWHAWLGLCLASWALLWVLRRQPPLRLAACAPLVLSLDFSCTRHFQTT